MKKQIFFYNENTNYNVQEKAKITRWIIRTIQNEKKEPGTINIIIVDDEYLVKMNKKFLKKNYLTDVITFNFNEEDKISGDVYISIDRVKENAKKYGCDVDSELQRVIIHGVLHLVGYKDDTSSRKKKMREREDYYLALL